MSDRLPSLKRFVGQTCWRLPCGRHCRVVAVDDVRRMLKINDPSIWTGWITEDNFHDKWDGRWGLIYAVKDNR
jgi:hypothetical protein